MILRKDYVIILILILLSVSLIIILCTHNKSKYKPHFLVIVAIFKNEKIAMKEWLNHYINQGVDHFYMINNGSTDDWEVEIENAPVTIHNDSKRHAQMEHYNYFLDTAKRNTEWIMTVDLDEFVYARDSKTIASVLKTYDPNIGMIKLRWKMFGSNSHIKQPKSIIQGFTKRNNMGDTNFKCITRSSVLKRLKIHLHDITKCEEIYEPKESTEQSLKDAKLQLNHYVIQSKDFFENVKMKRGDVWNQESENIRHWEYFKERDKNHIIDTELSDISQIKKLRCAICIAGEARNYKSGFNIIDKFIKNNKNIHIDIFLHVWYEEGMQFYKSKSGNIPIPPNLIEDLRKLYKPKVLKVQTPVTSINWKICPLIYKDKPAFNHMSQLYGKKMIRDELNKYIQEHSIKYDFVLTTRYDLKHPILVNLESLDNNLLYFSSCCREKNKHMPPPDNIVIMSLNNYLNVYNLYEDMDKICSSKNTIQKSIELCDKDWVNGAEFFLLTSIIYHRLLEKCRFIDEIPNFV